MADNIESVINQIKGAGYFKDFVEIENMSDKNENNLNNVNNNIIFIGDGALKNESIINREFNTIDGIKKISLKIESQENSKQRASSLGMCAYNKYMKKNDIYSADTIMPLYLRKSQAERMKEEKK